MPAWTLAEAQDQLTKAKADLERARKAAAYSHNSPSGGRTHTNQTLQALEANVTFFANLVTTLERKGIRHRTGVPA